VFTTGGRRRDYVRRSFPWALLLLLLGTLAEGVLLGLLVGRIIGGGNREEAAPTRPPRTVTVEETVEKTVEETVEKTVEETVEKTVEETVSAATPDTTTATATPTATATATAPASAAEEQYVGEEQYGAGVGEALPATAPSTATAPP
jgi:cytoskeletal protein RodZ